MIFTEERKVLCGSALVGKIERISSEELLPHFPLPTPWSVVHFTDREVGCGDGRGLGSEVKLDFTSGILT